MRTKEDALLVLWQYLCVNDKSATSDALFVFGGRDVAVARHAAHLYNQGMAPLILISGNRGAYTKEWPLSEAEIFANAMKEQHVPEEVLVLEKEATNSQENVRFGMRRLLEVSTPPNHLLLISIPFMMRRCLALFADQYPEIETRACPPPGTLADYKAYAPYNFDQRLVNEIWRLKNYPAKGFFQPLVLPDEVEKAYAYLISHYPLHDYPDTP